MIAESNTAHPSSPPRRSAPSHGPEAEALLDEVRASVATLTGLLVYERDLGGDAAASIRRAIEEVEARLSRRELRVALVGEPGAGKSTLLDALLGERVLGTTTTAPGLVVRVRRANERAYRARLKVGTVEDFAKRFPDPTSKLADAVVRAEAECLEAQRRAEEATIEVVAANDAVEVAESGLAAGSRALELAQKDDAGFAGNLERADRALSEAIESVDRAEKGVPSVLRNRPPWWALWLWVARFVAFVFASRRFSVYRRCVTERDDREREVATCRLEANRAADRRREAEDQLARASGPVEKAQKALAATRRIRGGADGRRETLERVASEKRDELEQAQKARNRAFASALRSLTDPGARGNEVAEIDVDFPATLLPNDVVVIDAAGATSRSEEIRDRAWRAIREQADGCIVVSELQHAVSSHAQKVLEQIRKAVPHAILVLTKMDESVAWAHERGFGDPAEEVERARKIGTRRFAREMGRDPGAVLSIAVSAEEALREGQGSQAARRRFESDVESAFQALRRERALILGARSAGVVRRAIGDAFEARANAERSYRGRIAALEAERIPGPDRFRDEQMNLAEPEILQAAAKVVAIAEKRLCDQVELVRVACAEIVQGAATKDELRALAPRLSQTIVRGSSLARSASFAELDARSAGELGGLERAVFGALRERYQLLHEVDRRPDSLHLEAAPDAPAPSVDLAPQIEAAISGGALAFARTLGRCRRGVVEACHAVIADLERDLASELRASQPAAAAALRAELDHSIERAVARFARWIAEPIDAEREVIDRERAGLRALEGLRERLAEHESRLAKLTDLATQASVGLYA